MTKKGLLVAAIVGVLAFTVGYAGTVKAWHSENNGYFYHLPEYGAWWDVWQPSWRGWTGDRWDCWGGDGQAIPYGVDSANELINYVTCKLWAGSARDHVGAAMMISSMTGVWSYDPPDWLVDEFVRRINYAASRGWINFGGADSCSQPNTFYQTTRVDVAYYWGCASGGNSAIIIYGGSQPYILKRYCGNPTGAMGPLADDVDFNMTGWTNIENYTDAARGANPYPGDVLLFRHWARNDGPTQTGQDIYSIAEDTSNGYVILSGSGWQNFGWYGAGESKNVFNTWLNVPWSDPPGKQYCRTTGVSPQNIYGGEPRFWGCATVQSNFSLTPTINLTTPSGNGTVQQGDQITFRYYIDNTSASGTSSSVACSVTGTGPAPTPAAPATTCPRTFAASNPAPGDQVSSETFTIGTQPVGSQICRTLTVNPASSGGSPASVQRCVVVAKTPYVHFMGGDVWAGGGFIQADGTCSTNASAKITTSSRQFSAFTSAPYTGQYYNNMTLSGSPAVTKTDSEVDFDWGAGAPVSGVNANNFSVRWTKTQNLPAGTYNFTVGTDDGVRLYVDGALIIDYWVDQGYTLHSAQRTLTAGNHNIVMEYYENGGAAAARLTIAPLNNSASGAGSAVEYAAFALSTINKFGSGNKALFDSANMGDPGRFLSFANNTSTIGNFGAPQHCLNDYASLYESLPVGGALPITSPVSGAWHSSSFPSLSGVAPAGVTKVYYSDADITITGNIQYPDTYSSVNDIPSILIIAKGNIYVNPGVTRMDGVYVARGTFYTCYPKPSPPSVSTCSSLLTVNGSVVAGQLDLYRTRGADGATTTLRQLPAEIFNLSTEVFLRNVLNNTARPSITTSDSREVPPRF